MVQETSLSPAEIQARLNHADELMAHVRQCNQQAADQLNMLAANWAGNMHTQHQGKMNAVLEAHHNTTNQYQQLLDGVKSGNSKIQAYDA